MFRLKQISVKRGLANEPRIRARGSAAKNCGDNVLDEVFTGVAWPGENEGLARTWFGCTNAFFSDLEPAEEMSALIHVFQFEHLFKDTGNHWPLTFFSFHSI